MSSKDMLGVAVRMLVTLPTQVLGIVCDLLQKLSDPDWVEAAKKFLRKEEISWAKEPQTTKPEPLFIPIGTVAIPATKTPLIARDRFVVNTEPDAPVKISYLGDNFKEWFLDKIEEPFESSTLRSAKLSRSSVDGPIIAELGGEEKAETTLTELFSLLEKQPDGKPGSLLTNGWWNILYIKDANRVLRAVFARWDGHGWGLFADAVASPSPWLGGNPFFSRDSR